MNFKKWLHFKRKPLNCVKLPNKCSCQATVVGAGSLSPTSAATGNLKAAVRIAMISSICTCQSQCNLPFDIQFPFSLWRFQFNLYKKWSGRSVKTSKLQAHVSGQTKPQEAKVVESHSAAHGSWFFNSVTGVQSRQLQPQNAIFAIRKQYGFCCYK